MTIRIGRPERIRLSLERLDKNQHIGEIDDGVYVARLDIGN